jgi:hypothetical protein
MAKKVSLSVNEMPINLDYFVESYLEHVVSGIIGSLHDTGEIETLQLNIDNEGQVEINLNNADVPLKYFPVEIIRSTIFGMIAPLKGVEGEINRVEITVGQ